MTVDIEIKNIEREQRNRTGEVIGSRIPTSNSNGNLAVGSMLTSQAVFLSIVRITAASAVPVSLLHQRKRFRYKRSQGFNGGNL